MDNILTTKTLDSPNEWLALIAERAKAQRLLLNLSQQGLAERSGVSLGSIKRFERSGEISLASLLKIAFVLDAQHDFVALFTQKADYTQKTMDQLLTKPYKRQRGIRK